MEIKQQAERYLERLCAHITQHGRRVAEIAGEEQVVIVLFEPAPEVRQRAHELGWDGRANVWPMSEHGLAELARGDDVTARWLRQDRSRLPARIFVLSGHGALLLNLHEGGFELEPLQGDARARD